MDWTLRGGAPLGPGAPEGDLLHLSGGRIAARGAEGALEQPRSRPNA